VKGILYKWYPSAPIFSQSAAAKPANISITPVSTKPRDGSGCSVRVSTEKKKANLENDTVLPAPTLQIAKEKTKHKRHAKNIVESSVTVERVPRENTAKAITNTSIH